MRCFNRGCAAMWPVLVVVCLVGVGSAFGQSAGQGWVVEDGEPRAQIVVRDDPPRTTRLAAQELQTYIEKISGEKLPIVTALRDDLPVKLYVGESAHTEALGLSTQGLKHGAYRMASGEDWLALIGQDDDFTPVEPWPRSNTHWRTGEVQEQWDQVTGAKWGVPMAGFYKHYTGHAGGFDSAGDEQPGLEEQVEVWAFDERGSFNAVCDYLRSLGVRWYMPGELGEVVPEQASIALPDVDQTVHPDFEMRRFYLRFGVLSREAAMWTMRLGLRDPYELEVAHGLATVSSRQEMKEAHPEYYALYGGERQNKPTQRYNHVCLSSEGLFDEVVRYVKTVADHYGKTAISVMPLDAFTAICQCELCEGKDTPERGYRGRMSDYVWGYVDRVAEEVAKTHPHVKVFNLAYGSYRQPPLNIDKLHPNVLVGIVGGRQPKFTRPEEREQARALRAAWLEKTDNKITNFENYPFTGRGWYMPAYTAHTIGESINAIKGESLGEDIWLTMRPGDLHAPGYNHFNIYFTARMYWGGQRDVDAMLDEYCRLFYGPAGETMKQFFEYCEYNWQDMQNDKEPVDRALELFAAAQAQVSESSVYGQRLALVADYLTELEAKGEQLGKAEQRGDVPDLGLGPVRGEVVIDGKFDDQTWQEIPYYANGSLRELQTGREPMFRTSFKAAWGRENIYFAIRCEDVPGEKLNIATQRNEDPAIWYGDVVEILLETDKQSYYQIAINPAGAIADLDKSAGRGGEWQWDSQAEVATHVGDGYWTVEVRIPVVEESNDPLHQVIGRKPSSSLPWYFNVCRQRKREYDLELSAFSPTGKPRFHEPIKFGELRTGR